MHCKSRGLHIFRYLAWPSFYPPLPKFLVSGVAGWMRRPAARGRQFDVKTVTWFFRQ